MNGHSQDYFDHIEQIIQNKKLYFAKIHYLKTLIEEDAKKEALEWIDEELLNE